LVRFYDDRDISDQRMTVVEDGLPGEAVVSNCRHPDLVVWLHFCRHSNLHKKPEKRERISRKLTVAGDRSWPAAALTRQAHSGHRRAAIQC